ncbi:MBL fold metallo-hydrolase [Candidatus Paracaedibacter symbiosus]|uniref:MBL fold metallo-hydrolase n=1 Tax=Candidatus Paracaedibacter symbiosus TaxID=244582 RepID=UPI0005096572|nr:MBL fold metallo-hydrolase [Candidatus Paracaedibacter symbiosus]
MKKYLIFIGLCFWHKLASATSTVDIFDVGQGNAVIVRYEKECLLVDAGSKGMKYSDLHQHLTEVDNYHEIKLDKIGESADEAFKNKRIQEMKEIIQDVEEVKIVITHPHDDHFNLIPAIFSDKESLEKIKKVVLGGLWKNYPLPFRNFLNNLAKDTTNLVKVLKKQNRKELDLDNFEKEIQFSFEKENSPPPKVQLLAMNADINSKNYNHNSIILRIYCEGSKSILLTGDATNPAWEQATRRCKKRPGQ